MVFDLENEHAAEAYKVLASLVTPRPIAWVTTLNSDGSVNAAPFSFFNVFGSKPPMLAFAPGDREPGVPKDTALNIRERGEFVVNLVDERVAGAMNQSAASLPYGASELADSGLSLIPSDSVATPRVGESPAALECVRHSVLEIGKNRLVIGIVQRVHVRDGIFDPATHRMNPGEFRPIGRMASPHWYCYSDNLFEMVRPD